MREDADVVRAYLALKAHHRHNTPPSTILAATAVILPTIHSINNSYNMDMCLLRGACATINVRSARCSSARAYSRVLAEALSAKVELSCRTNTISTVGVVGQRRRDELCVAFQWIPSPASVLRHAGGEVRLESGR
jgi:hypothetical protein